MRPILNAALAGLLLVVVGCDHPYSRKELGKNSEWFVFVGTQLSEAVYLRFAKELPIFASQIAAPGDVIHLYAGDGIVSFTLHVPNDPDEQEEFNERIKFVTDYFLSGTRIDGLDSCHIDLEFTEIRMKQSRETNWRHPVVILGCERPTRFLHFGCNCANRPHSLLSEVLAGNCHPEYRVDTRKMIDFEQNYSISY